MIRFITEGLRTVCGGPFSFSVEAGECVVLSGPSGCGKSLLLRALADLDPAEGSVFLDGVGRKELPAPDWRRQVGWLPAEAAWWFDLVKEHFPEVGMFHPSGGVKIPGVGNAGGEASRGWNERFQWLERLGFEKEVLDWRVERLSTGEKQRLGLFRLLLNEPKVLLLDEPTAALDVSNVGRVEEVVAGYQRATGAAVLWVSHSPEQIARVADRHLEFRGGRLEEVE